MRQTHHQSAASVWGSLRGGAIDSEEPLAAKPLTLHLRLGAVIKLYMIKVEVIEYISIYTVSAYVSILCIYD